jgi:hypothetical protein
MAGLETLVAGLAKLLALALPYILAYRAGRTATDADQATCAAKTEKTYAETLIRARPGDAADRLRRGAF